MDERATIDRDDSMWQDNWHSLEALLAATTVADAAIRTSTTLATVVIGTIALAILWWYLVQRDRHRD